MSYTWLGKQEAHTWLRCNTCIDGVHSVGLTLGVGPALTVAPHACRRGYLSVICTSLDGRRPANLQIALVTWYASASST
jgi:hypothetical protein